MRQKFENAVVDALMLLIGGAAWLAMPLGSLLIQARQSQAREREPFDL